MVQLSEVGETAHHCWEEIPSHFPFVIWGEFVVMPNHIHGIVIIDKHVSLVEKQDLSSMSPSGFASLQDDYHQEPCNEFGQQSKNLTSIIRGFKVSVTTSSRLIIPDFAWQARYNDRIIRDQPEHERIDHYIRENPINWKQDEFY
ncbi:MAG TPA: hypothetical protein PKA53_09790 [Sphingobacterium sp.]|nr:hypothetical protein [Sphingobacterium sp.]